MGNVDDVLAHYGVKGMRWGVTRSREPSSVTLKTTPGRKVQTSGGRNQPASDDAKETATQRQRAKASTTDALSNKELKALVERMQLEANYQRLSAKQKGLGRKFVEKLFKDPNARKQTVQALDKVVDTVTIPMQISSAIARTDLTNIGK